MKKGYLQIIMAIIGVIIGIIMLNLHLKRTIKGIVADERAKIREEVKEQAKEAIHELLNDPTTQREITNIIQSGVSRSFHNDLEPVINRILESKFPFLKKGYSK